jgi:Tol biopolymer transport system component
VDRAGHSTQLIQRRAGYRLPRLSKNGRFVAVTIDPPDESDSHVWILDLQRGAFSKLTREGHNLGPIFTADGSGIAWGDWHHGPKVYWQPADGSGKRQRLGGLEPSVPLDFSPDGKYVVLAVGRPRRSLRSSVP